MSHFLQGLTDVTPLQSEIDRLAVEKDVIDGHERQKQLLAMEQDLQQEYAPAIEAKDLSWWDNETKKLHTSTAVSSSTETAAVYKRVLGFLSLNCYMYSNAALKQGNLALASKFIEIYRMVDPENAEHRYMAAKVAALNNKPDELFEALKQAFDLGFKDISRLKSDADFNAWQKDARFTNLVSVK
jgi:hypothetical protein